MSNKKPISKNHKFYIIAAILGILLVVIIILAVLPYYICITCSGNEAGIACLYFNNYTCQNPSMNASGYLSLTISQDTGRTEYNIGLLCYQYGARNNSTDEYMYVANITGNYVAQYNLTIPQNMLNIPSGGQVHISKIICYNADGEPLLSASNIFVGTLKINYTNENVAPGPSNPWHTATLATVSIKVT